MAIITVLGPIEPMSVAGTILPHEHIFLDLTNQYRPFPEATRVRWGEEKVSLETIGILARNPLALRDNLLLDDPMTAEREIMEFKRAGGGLIADVTTIGIGRDPVALKGLSRATGVHIVTGCGYYYHATHPQGMGERSVEELAEEMVREILIGIGDSGVRAGVIGEIGISEVMHQDEAKILAAAARAQKKTGVGVQVHIFPWNPKGPLLGLDALDILCKNGANPRKISINHVDVAMEINVRYISEIIARGAYVEFDNFGHQFYVDKRSRTFLPGPMATDIQRIRTIVDLVEKGHIGNILACTDICHKNLLHTYGGWGYDHLITNVIPMLREYGLSDNQLRVLTEENPRDFLTAAAR
jgi:phosphotriesterase-related protein